MSTKTLEKNTAQDFAELQIDQLSKLRNGNITFEQVKWFNNLSFEQREVLMCKQPVKAPILKLISEAHEIVIEACDGSEIIETIEEAFRSGMRGTNKVSAPTEKTPVQVYEMVKDATLAQIFGSLGIDLDKLCLTQHQIKTFCEVHKEWLRKDEYNTFFLSKVGEEFLVTRVMVLSYDVDFKVHRLKKDYVFPADCSADRVVVPQLTA